MKAKRTACLARSPDVGLEPHLVAAQGRVQRQMHRVLGLAGVVLVDQHRVLSHLVPSGVPEGKQHVITEGRNT